MADKGKSCFPIFLITFVCLIPLNLPSEEKTKEREETQVGKASDLSCHKIAAGKKSQEPKKA